MWWRLASPPSTSMLVREGDTIILSQVSTFFEQLVSTIEVAMIGESPHVIDVYLVNSDCHHLPITSTNHTTESSNFTNVTYYLMPGSRIHYNICATSNFSVTERIHLVILDNLEEGLASRYCPCVLSTSLQTCLLMYTDLLSFKLYPITCAFKRWLL